MSSKRLATLFAIVVIFLFLIQSQSHIFAENNSRSEPRYSPNEQENLDYTSGGVHLLTGSWWEPENYQPSVSDWDGDGINNANDSHPLDSALPTTSLEKQSYPCNVANVTCVGDYLGSSEFGEPGWTSPGQDNTQAIAVADVDRDGDLDLAIANLNAKARILENIGGSFPGNTLWESDEILDCDGMAFGDVDGDGFPELALALFPILDENQERTQGGRSVILRNIQGTYLDTPIWTQPILNAPENSTIGGTEDIEFGDVDGDGDLDLIVGNAYNSTRLYMNDEGAISDVPYWESDYVGRVEDVELGDLDGDGDMELAISKISGMQEIYAWENRPIFSPQKMNYKVSSEHPYQNDTDELIGTISIPGVKAIRLHFENFSTRVYDPVEIQDLNGNLLQYYWGDLGNFTTRWFDVDGITITFRSNGGTSDYGFDITGYDQGIEAGSENSFSHSPIWSTGRMGNPLENPEYKLVSSRAVSFADVDSDGDLDLSIGFTTYANYLNDCYFLGRARIYENINGTIDENHMWENEGPCMETTDLTWIDMDLDGDLDLIQTSDDYYFYTTTQVLEHSEPIMIYENNPNGLEKSASWVSDTTYSVMMAKAADFDGNGRMDFITGTLSFNDLYYSSTNSIIDQKAWTDSTTHPFGASSVRAGWDDVDDDGDLDLAISNFGQGAELFLNENSSLSLIPDWNSSGPSRLQTKTSKWADINDDGIEDLIIGYYGDGPLELYLGNSSGIELTPQWTSNDNYRVNDLIIGDINGDNYPEIITVSYLDNVRIFHNSQGQLSKSPDWQTTSKFKAISGNLVDYDLDGDLDLFLCNYGEEDKILDNDNGIMGNVPSWESSTIANCVTSQWGDLDNNGYPDLIVANFESNDTLNLNFGGEVADIPNWKSGKDNNSNAISVIDFNSDGWEDIVISSSDNDTDIYFNNNGNFPEYPDWNSSKSTRVLYHVIDDFDNDQYKDLLLFSNPVLNTTSRIYEEGYLWKFNGTSAINGHLENIPHQLMELGVDLRSTSISVTTRNQSHQIFIGGFNDIDQVLILNKSGNYSITEWEVNSRTKYNSYSVSWGDFDNDGDSDLMVANRADHPSQLYENVNGTLSDVPIWETDGRFNSRAMAWGDMNNDGWLDAVFGNDGDVNQIYFNRNGTLESIPTWNSSYGFNTGHLTLGDIDSNGWLDIVVANYFDPIQIFYNYNGTISNVSSWNSTEMAKATHSSLGDFDKDGDLDLAISNVGNGGGYPVQVYLNNGTGYPNSPEWNSSSYLYSRGLEWGDADGDGDLDLAVSTETALLLFLNQDGVLSKNSYWSSNSDTVIYGVSFADINLDGTLDILTIDIDGPNSIYLSSADTDGDFVPDSIDAYPLDPTQFEDDDSDGFGDNQQGRMHDNCPSVPGTSWRDRRGCSDMDMDGQSDLNDAFMNKVTQWTDADNDGLGDNFPSLNSSTIRNELWPGTYVADAWNSDPSPLDYDNDGYEDQSLVHLGAMGPFDDCPLFFGTSYLDKYGCPDSDGDGWSDDTDSHPGDWTQQIDPDGDGFGDNTTGNLPDNCPTSWGNSTKDRFGCPDVDGDGWSHLSDYDDYDSSTWSDTDGDTFTDQLGHPMTDDCPGIPGNSTIYLRGCRDYDGDGIPDSLDADIDGDGILNYMEIELDLDPLNDTIVPSDWDKDGFPDELDDDDDNDGFPDSFELERGSDPLDPDETPLTQYAGIPTGFYYVPGDGFSTKYSEDGFEISLDGFLTLLSSELILPLLIIPITAYVLVRKRTRYRDIREEILSAPDHPTLIELEEHIEKRLGEGKLKAEHAIMLRRAISLREKDLLEGISADSTSVYPDHLGKAGWFERLTSIIKEMPTKWKEKESTVEQPQTFQNEGHIIPEGQKHLEPIQAQNVQPSATVEQVSNQEYKTVPDHTHLPGGGEYIVLDNMTVYRDPNGNDWIHLEDGSFLFSK